MAREIPFTQRTPKQETKLEQNARNLSPLKKTLGCSTQEAKRAVLTSP